MEDRSMPAQKKQHEETKARAVPLDAESVFLHQLES
jgi:hypothetical protein